MARKRRERPLEAEVQKVCIQWLRLRGLFVVRLNSGGMVVPRPDGRGTRLVRFNDQPGCGDALLVVRGRAVFLEFKRPGESPTPLQTSFMDEARRKGGAVACVVRSLEDLQEALRGEGLL